jgi:hypothetical protein
MPMIVKIDFSGLAETRWHEYAIRFAAGGAVTVIAGIIAKKWGPGVGGLFLAFPATFPASATLVEKHERQRKERKGLQGERRGEEVAAADAIGAAIGSLGLIAFAAAGWEFFPLHSAALVLAGGTSLWGLVSVSGWLIRKRGWRIFYATRSQQRAR